MNFRNTAKQEELLRLCISDAEEILAFGGSRSGKTIFFIKAIVIRALKCAGSRHAILRQRFKHLKQSVIFDTFPEIMRTAFSGVSFKLNRSDWFIKFPNGSEIWFGGLDDKDRTEKILGTEYSTIFLNEASQIGYRSYVLAKTRLAEKNELKKKIYIDENPPSKNHWTYKMFFEFIEAQDGEPIDKGRLASLQMNPSDNREHISSDYFKRLEALPENERARFLSGIFSETISGGVYTKELNAAEIGGRIKAIEADKDYPLTAVFDIGTSDATAIWFVQFLKERILFLDYYENNFEALPHYLKVIGDRGYRIKTMVLPHDARNKNWATGKSIREAAEEYGEKIGFRVEVLPAMSLIDGINAARTIFSICYFEQKRCSSGLEALRNYHFEFNEKLGKYNDEPLHDWASHGADAFRYACLAYNKANIREPVIEQERREGFTFNDLLKRKGIRIY
jgi:PBSX family phage terminase large subunit